MLLKDTKTQAPTLRDNQRSIDRAFIGERSSPRHGATFHVQYHGTGVMVARRGNLGIGGFCFEGEKLYEVGTEVEMVVQLPGSQRPIRARGRILGHSSSTGFLGVRGQFTELDFGDERRLARWLDSISLNQQFPQAA